MDWSLKVEGLLLFFYSSFDPVLHQSVLWALIWMVHLKEDKEEGRSANMFLDCVGYDSKRQRCHVYNHIC